MARWSGRLAEARTRRRDRPAQHADPRPGRHLARLGSELRRGRRGGCIGCCSSLPAGRLRGPVAGVAAVVAETAYSLVEWTRPSPGPSSESANKWQGRGPISEVTGVVNALALGSPAAATKPPIGCGALPAPLTLSVSHLVVDAAAALSAASARGLDGAAAGRRTEHRLPRLALRARGPGTGTRTRPPHWAAAPPPLQRRACSGYWPTLNSRVRASWRT